MEDGDACTAQCPSYHDIEPGYGSYQDLFEESELLIPDHFDTSEKRGEEDAHADDSRSEEFDIIAAAGFLIDRSETESQSDQKKQRLSERTDDPRLGSEISFDLPHPEDIYRCHIISINDK